MHPSDQPKLLRPLHHPSITPPGSNITAPKASSAPETPVHGKPDSKSLTPPLTPLRPDIIRTTASSDLGHLAQDTLCAVGLKSSDANVDFGSSLTPTTEEMLSWEKTVPRPCTKKYQRQGSASSGDQELGRGAWSTVFRATLCLQFQPSSIPTPPTSPVSSSSKTTINRLLAIKAAARRDAHDILYQEARILTYLHSCAHASRYLVPFHGYDVASQSLVMDAVPLNLDTHAKSCLKRTCLNFSTKTMFDPVCGTREWKSLAAQLINGLAFLHSRSCVHGDIKPANILLRPNGDDSSEAYTALYCDFSSSRIFSGDSRNDEDRSQQLTALTPDFTSPELFTSLYSTSAVATMASDVYALGVTLVVAAIGTSPYASAGMDMLKLGMAREGRVLDFARQGEQGTRVMKGKMVERCLKGALEKSTDNRSTVGQWKRDVDAVFDNAPHLNKM
ncbi:MAG: hypothetical protein Q9188_000701 [Gyalolechia gomerana]